MAVYPLPIIEQQNYHYGGIRFGASREDGGLARREAFPSVLGPRGAEFGGEIMRTGAPCPGDRAAVCASSAGRSGRTMLIGR